MTLGVRYIFLDFVLNRLATIFLVRGYDGLAVLFDQNFSILVIDCMELPLIVIDSAAVADTFTRAAADTAAPTIASNGLNAGNISEKIIIWHLGYIGCEVISRLRICNAVKVRPNFKSLDCVLELRVLDPPE